MTQQERFNHWAIVEVFGHQTYAGRVTEQTVGGASFVRVDVPAVRDLQPFTKLFGASAIYGITIVDEQTARAKAAGLQQQPITTWEIGQLVGAAVEKRLLESQPVESADFDDEEDYPL